MVARLEERKGHRRFILAALALGEGAVAVAGRGARIRRRRSGNGQPSSIWPNRCNSRTGSVSSVKHADPWSLYAVASVVVLPLDRTRGLPYRQSSRAMAAGRPVVATSVAGIPRSGRRRCHRACSSPARSGGARRRHRRCTRGTTFPARPIGWVLRVDHRYETNFAAQRVVRAVLEDLLTAGLEEPSTRERPERETDPWRTTRALQSSHARAGHRLGGSEFHR